MPRTLQFKRYANTALNSITGSDGELILDGTNHTVTVHDGVTVGGTRLATESFTISQVTNSALAEAAYNQANSATALAAGAFNEANTANFLAYTSSVQTPVIFNTANAASNTAQAAYDTANVSITNPQNARSSTYTLANTDSGKHLYYTNAANASLYIPWSSNVGFGNGTSIIIVSHTSTANVIITPNTGVTLFLAGNTTSSNRNVTTYGVATLMQVAANTWVVYGTGVV
jgi:hypothetical protein